MGTYCAQGIILKHHNYREADRLVTAYSKEYGKFIFVGRGARKITSKLGGSLEPLSTVRLNIVRGRSFDTVTDCEVVRSFTALKSNISNVYVAGKLSALVDAIVKENQRDIRIYDLLEKTYVLLDTKVGDRNSRNKLVWYFVWRLLLYLGYQPELVTCLVSGERLAAGDLFFNFRRGGLMNSTAKKSNDAGQMVGPNVVKVLRMILDDELEALFRVGVDRQTTDELNSLTPAFLCYTQEIDFGIKTLLNGA